MPTTMKSQLQWTYQVKTNGCYGCHQLGNKATRVIPKELGTFKSDVTHLAFSPDGKTWASVCPDGTVLLWKVPGDGK